MCNRRLCITFQKLIVCFGVFLLIVVNNLNAVNAVHFMEGRAKKPRILQIIIKINHIRRKGKPGALVG